MYLASAAFGTPGWGGGFAQANVVVVTPVVGVGRCAGPVRALTVNVIVAPALVLSPGVNDCVSTVPTGFADFVRVGSPTVKPRRTRPAFASLACMPTRLGTTTLPAELLVDPHAASAHTSAARNARDHRERMVRMSATSYRGLRSHDRRARGVRQLLLEMTATDLNVSTTTFPPPSARRLRLGAVLVVAWLVCVMVTALASLVDRPAYSGTQTVAWVYFVWVSIPVVTVAVFAMRTPGILVAFGIACAGYW